MGLGACENLLAEPATPGTPKACKRLFSPGKTTPRGRPRKFSSTQMSSPALRRNLVTIVPDYGENAVVNTGALKQVMYETDINEEVYGAKVIKPQKGEAESITSTGGSNNKEYT